MTNGLLQSVILGFYFGSKITGGGYIKNSVMEVAVDRQSSTEPDTWEVQAFNFAQFGEPSPLQAYAECAELEPES